MKTKSSDKNSSLIETIFKYARSTIFNRLFSLIYSYIKPRFLSPELMGLWSLLNTIIKLSSYSHLGSKTAIIYLIPPLERENKREEIENIKGAVYYGAYYVNLLIIIALLITAYFSNYPIEHRVGLVAVACIIFFKWQYDYFIAVLKGSQRFNIIIKTNYLMPTVRLVIGFTLIYYFGIYGLFTTSLFTLIVVVVYIRSKYLDEIKNKFKFSIYKKLVISGIGIMLFNSSLAILMMTNRVVISYFLGLKQLGFYSIALIIAEIIMQLPMASRDVIEPKVAQLIETQAIEKTLNDYYFKPLYNIAYYCPFLVFGVFFTLTPAIQLLLPNYIEGVNAAKVLVFGTAFLALTYSARVFIVINKKQLISVVWVSLALIINVVMSVFFIKELNYDIVGVALATVISHAALFLMLYISVARIYKKVNKYCYHLFYIGLPSVLSIFIVFIVNDLANQYIIYNEYVISFVGLLLSSLIMYFIIIILNKQNPLIYLYRSNKT